MAKALSVQAGAVLYVTQVGLYLLGIYLVAREASAIFGRRAGTIVWCSLLANIFIYPYLAIALTDGFSVILLIYACFLVLKIFGGTGPLTLSMKSAALSGILGWVIGFAIMVRPANIGWLLFLIPIVFVWRLNCAGGARCFVVLAAASCLGIAVAFAPQLKLNLEGFNQFTFLPTRNLGEDQIRWGITRIKYATDMVHGVSGLGYLNPYVGDGADSLSWYVRHPISGAKTLSMHVFAALDFDYLFPYIYNYNPPYRPLLFLYSQCIVFWGLVGCLLATSRHEGDGGAAQFRFLFLSLLAVLLAGWTAIHAVTAVENRFALPVISVMLPLAGWALFFRARKLKHRNWLYGVFGMYLFAAWQLSTFISGLRNI